MEADAIDILIHYGDYFLLGLLFLVLILFILVVGLLLQMKKMRKRLDRFLGTGSDRHDMEVMLDDFLARTEAVDEKYVGINRRMDDLEDRLSFCIQKTGLLRYNPFQDTGGDLSFALALLDDHHDGIVISSLYGRDSCYVFGKTVSDGHTEHSLSPEERTALEMAMER